VPGTNVGDSHAHRRRHFLPTGRRSWLYSKAPTRRIGRKTHSRSSIEWEVITKEPRWYLPLVGVDPGQGHQGRGYGSALMTYTLLPSDAERNLAYLESSNPRNISPCIRHGFEMLGTIQIGDSPPVFPMLRNPR